MKTVIILGAGATRGAMPVNADFPPPLLRDLPALVSADFLSLNRSKDGPAFAEGFNRLLDLTGTRNDVERYFTVLHVLGLMARQINGKHTFLSDAEIDELISSHRLNRVFGEQELVAIAERILCFLRDDKRYALLNYPGNFQTIFQNSLREYFFVALSNCYCARHRVLFDPLQSDDVVVNFNYDEVADFTLFSTNRLNRESFSDIPFSGMVFPRETDPNCRPVRYLKVHGSFNWWTDINDTSKVFYCLISEASTTEFSHKGNTFFPIILPTLTKEIIYRQYPIYQAHIQSFLSHLTVSDRLVLVGKSFMNSDQELNSMIRDACRRTRRILTFADPSSIDPAFTEYHEKLFNGRCEHKYDSLAALANGSAL